MELEPTVEEKQNVSNISKSESPQMFNRISGRYDFLNHFLSMGQDIRWRNKAVKQFKNSPGQIVLDVATGTADLILTAFKKNPNISKGVGIDPAINMLKIGVDKVQELGLEKVIKLLPGDGQNLPFSDQTFHGAMIAFGIRNLENYKKGLQELYRVLKRDGRLVVLEFSVPSNFLFRKFYLFYFRKILPGIGGFFSGDKSAYKYLNKTVESFVYGEKFCGQLREVGFQSVKMIPLTFGIATIYIGDK